MKYRIAALVLLATLAGCDTQPTVTPNATPAEPAPAPASHTDAARNDSAISVALITELYNDYVFGRKEFDKVAADYFCTEHLAEKLKADYEYDGEGYAVWDFRSDAQDGQAGDGLKGVLKTADMVFTAVIVDNGVKLNVDFFMVKDKGILKIDDVEVIGVQKCNLCNGTKEVTCPTCKGEGFFYTPNDAQGEDWGQACFDCGGRGYGHRNGNDATLTVGKGHIPCPACVTEIVVDVPQATNQQFLAPVGADIENRLVGNHGVRLQWISDKNLGNVNIEKEAVGVYTCVGRQQGEEGDYLCIDGKLKVVNLYHLVFQGTITCHISHIHKGKPYVRKGIMDFVNKNGARKFWRLQQMDNGDCTDYVDIFM